MAGLACIPLLGVQNDETLFASPWYKPRGGVYSLRIGSAELPLMLMNYLGTVKTFLYWPLFHWFGTGVWAIRVPMLLAGVASIWLFYFLLRRVAGNRAALVGSGLLATDACYLLSSCFDWGPVALQHLLLVAGLLAVVRFWQERSERMLALGFFLFGLALWDKALALWSLSGFGVAALFTMPRQMWEAFTFRRLILAIVAFALGAFPLLMYNFDSSLGTFQGTVAYDSSKLSKKTFILANTLSGSILFGWMTAEDRDTPQPHLPYNWLESASAKLASMAGNPRESLSYYLFWVGVLLALLARGADLRAICFAAIAMAITWCQMLYTAGAGAAVHHTILLWPLPQMLIAVSLAAASRRLGRAAVPALAAVAVVAIGSGVVLINQYYFQMVRNGGGQNWTDSIYRLSAYMKRVRAPRRMVRRLGHFG